FVNKSYFIDTLKCNSSKNYVRQVKYSKLLTLVDIEQRPPTTHLNIIPIIDCLFNQLVVNGHLELNPGPDSLKLLLQSGIKIVHLNANGFYRRKSEIQFFIEKYKINVICITESHLNDHCDTEIKISGYNCYRLDSERNKFGGI
ncbi:hypothetical protein B4U80_14837, partial [Leptotrombidium deliense]